MGNLRRLRFGLGNAGGKSREAKSMSDIYTQIDTGKYSIAHRRTAQLFRVELLLANDIQADFVEISIRWSHHRKR